MNLPTAFLALRERFIARLPERLEQMRAQRGGLDENRESALNEIKRLAHSLVGAAGLHDMEQLARAAAELERLAAAEAADSELDRALDHLAGLITHQSPQPVPQSSLGLKPCRIALLFQDPEEMAAQSALLSDAGYQVDTYTRASALEAACAAGRAPALVLMGLQFDGDDQAGLDILKQLKPGPLTTTPIIVLSASHSVERGLLAYRAGATRVLTKPISPQALSRHLAAALAADGEEALDMLLLQAGNAPGPDWVSRLKSLQKPRLATRHCQQAGQLFDRLTEGRPDAIVLDLSDRDESEAGALIALVRDHPSANHVPIIGIDTPASQRRRALWQAGCSCVFDADGSAGEFGLMLSTLCNRARSVRQTIEEAARYRYEHSRQYQALEHHAIISMADATGTVYETSARYAHLTGFERTELIGAHLSEQRPGMAPPEFDEQIMDQLRQGRVWQGEYRAPGRGKQARWFNATLVPFLDRTGQPYRYMVIRSDITERKLGEQALVKAHDREMRLAGQIQDNLLVPPIPWVVGGVPLASRFQAAAGVAGDFHALVELQPGVFDVLIGDVMGKGVSAALVGAACKMALHQCLLELRARGHGQAPGPADIVGALHQQLSQRLIDLECFVTLAYARFDQAAGTMTSVGCGHPEILLCDAGRSRLAGNRHPPLGTLAEECYSETVTNWPPGSLAVLYSDGLTEMRAADGSLLGEAGLQQLLARQQAIDPNPAALTAAVMHAVEAFAEGQAPTDDRTLIIVHNPTSAERHVELPAGLDSIAQLRSFLAGQALPDLHGDRLDRLVLACVEAFSNAVRHGAITSRIVQLSCLHETNRIRIVLYYDGPDRAPPEAGELPDPAALQESGYGLALIKQLCDDCQYHHHAGHNRLTLVFEQPRSS